ncbi:MAG: YfhO family protein [Roseburia sp.]|nr:YfhO family protein [Roseburia sp.]
MAVKNFIKSRYFIFTVCFWAFTGPLVYYISSLGLCMTGTGDAISQHYPIMVYVRSLWIDFWQALLHGERFVFPMVNFSIGMGDDTIMALNYYGLNDPFYLLTVLVSEENLPYFYSVLFYLRVYLGGVAFIAFATELDGTKSGSAYVMGALVYCFTGFTLMSNMHIIFVHAMFYIPLLLLGAERVMNQKKRGLLCVTVCCFALSGFFFLYIGSVSLAVYVLYRLCRRRTGPLESLSKICGMLLEYFVGIGMAAVIFVPSVFGFLLSNRGRVGFWRPLILSWPEIKDILKNMFFPSYYENRAQELAICTVGMIALICVLLARKRIREKLNLAALFLTAIMPFFSYAMSGFNGFYERWELVIDLYIAFCVFSIWDELGQITLFQKAGLVLVYLMLGIVGKKEDILTQERFGRTIQAYGLILLVLLILLPLLKRLKREKAGMYILFAAGWLTICMNWKAVARDADIELLQRPQAVRELTDIEGQKEVFYRIENERGFAEPRFGMNISMQQGYYGTMSYVSITNDRYAQAFENWDIAGANYNIYGLDQRTIPETLCAVKYFVVKTENAGIVPYGFAYVSSTQDGEWSLYENSYSLPVAYTYENVYDIEDYRAMSGLEKQQIMMQAAAVEGDISGEYRDLPEPPGSLYEGTYEITGLSDAVWEDNAIRAEAGGTITLEVTIRSGCESYLFFTGSTDWIGGIDIKNRYVKYVRPLSPLAVNLGAAQTDTTAEIVITFSHAAALDMDMLQVVYYDFRDYAKQIEALKADTDGKFRVETNRIRGTVDLSRDKILCFSVPYSIGWHARIDGEKAQVHPVNDMFAGIEVPAGAHEVELYYVTPGMRLGIGISIGSWLFAIGYLMRRRLLKGVYLSGGLCYHKN